MMEQELNELALELVRTQKQLKASQGILEVIAQAFREVKGRDKSDDVSVEELVTFIKSTAEPEKI